MQTVHDRALQSGGVSADAIYRCVAAELQSRHPGGGRLLDVGCGKGKLWDYIKGAFSTYAGADVIRHAEFPADGEFCAVDLDTNAIPLPDGYADVVCAVETIEHLENPRAFFRTLVRLVRPGGWCVVTTPNQLSFLSKLTLVLKNQFNAFQDSCYPAHLTALLEVDLRRIAAECGLGAVEVVYSRQGRLPSVSWHYPAWLSNLFPRTCSDNVLLVGRKDSPNENR